MCYETFKYIIPIKHNNNLYNHIHTLYLRLYSVRRMLKDHSDNQRGNPLPPLHGLLFLISSKGSYIDICTTPQTGYHIQRPQLIQSCSTGWNKKQLKDSTMRDYTPTTHRTVSGRSTMELYLSAPPPPPPPSLCLLSLSVCVCFKDVNIY